jgi:hypothetical protein
MEPFTKVSMVHEDESALGSQLVACRTRLLVLSSCRTLVTFSEGFLIEGLAIQIGDKIVSAPFANEDIPNILPRSINLRGEIMLIDRR